MTDLIEQAHGRRISAALACDDCDLEPWIETVGGGNFCTQHYEERLIQAVRREHPDVVRLVEAARLALPALEQHGKRASFYEWNLVSGALASFTEVRP